MSSANIEIIDVDYADVMKKNGKGTYGKLTVTHKTDEGKVEAKAVMDFATPKDVFQRLRTAVKGDTFSITREKDDNGYWIWTGVDTQTMPVGQKAATFTATPSKPNYESADERAARQVYIIKQSSLATTVELLKSKDPSPEEVIRVAELFVQYVLGQRVEDMKDDIPF